MCIVERQIESAALSATAREREPPLDYLCAHHAATQMAGYLPCASETATGNVRQGKVRQGGREERRVLARITHQPSPHFASPISLATRLALSTSLSLVSTPCLSLFPSWWLAGCVSQPPSLSLASPDFEVFNAHVEPSPSSVGGC